MTTKLLLIASILAASSSGVAVARRSSMRRRAAAQASCAAAGDATEAPPVVVPAPVEDPVEALLWRALAEQASFEASHPIPYDWHQRRVAVRGRLEQLLHLAGLPIDAGAIRSLVEDIIPHPPADERQPTIAKR